MDIKLSIIVPIYNVENYLEYCLNSIVPILSNENVELILVNDGSTDKSESICNMYIEKYKNVRYIYQDNQGLSEARNTGIKNSNGKYVTFIDSDDFINYQILLDFLNSFDTPDVIFLNAVKYLNGNTLFFGEDYKVENIVNKPKSEVLKELCQFRKFPGSAWNKIVKRELIVREKVFFEKGIYSEDIEWSMRLFNGAKTFSYLEGEYYYYRQGRKDSITGNISEENINSLLYILEKNVKSKFDKNIEKYLYSFLSYEYIVLLFLIGNKNIRCNSNIKRRIYKLRFLLLKSSKITYKIIFPIITLFGIEFMSIILRMLKRKI